MTEVNKHLASLFTFPAILSIKLIDPLQKEVFTLQRNPPSPPQTWGERLLFGANHKHNYTVTPKTDNAPDWLVELEINNARIPTTLGHDLAIILLNSVAMDSIAEPCSCRSPAVAEISCTVISTGSESSSRILSIIHRDPRLIPIFILIR